MKWKGRKAFLFTGGITAVVGFIISVVGLNMLSYYDTIYHDTYWPATMQVYGLVMMLVGSVIVIINCLRDE